jgi:hypothetical protein
MVVVATGTDEGRARPVPLHKLEAQHVTVELESPVELCNLEVYVSDIDPRIDGCA